MLNQFYQLPIALKLGLVLKNWRPIECDLLGIHWNCDNREQSVIWSVILAPTVTIPLTPHQYCARAFLKGKTKRSKNNRQLIRFSRRVFLVKKFSFLHSKYPLKNSWPIFGWTKFSCQVSVTNLFSCSQNCLFVKCFNSTKNWFFV